MTEFEGLVEEMEGEDGLVTLKLTPEEARRLKGILAQRSNLVRRPRIHQEGNKVIIDTGLDEHCTFNKGTPQEVHALRVYTRAESHDINANNEVINIVPAVTVVERIEGGYCYMDGTPIKRREDLEIISKPLRQTALDWFDRKYPSGEEGAIKKRARAA